MASYILAFGVIDCVGFGFHLSVESVSSYLTHRYCPFQTTVKREYIIHIRSYLLDRFANGLLILEILIFLKLFCRVSAPRRIYFAGTLILPIVVSCNSAAVWILSEAQIGYTQTLWCSVRHATLRSRPPGLVITGGLPRSRPQRLAYFGLIIIRWEMLSSRPDRAYHVLFHSNTTTLIILFQI